VCHSLDHRTQRFLEREAVSKRTSYFVQRSDLPACLTLLLELPLDSLTAFSFSL
jgi:hypothetical protein